MVQTLNHNATRFITMASYKINQQVKLIDALDDPSSPTSKDQGHSSMLIVKK